MTARLFTSFQPQNNRSRWDTARVPSARAALTRRRAPFILSCAAALLLPSLAAAQEPPPAGSAPVSDGAPAFSFQDGRSGNIGRYVALGYDNGLWGSGFAQGLRLDVPIGPHFAVRARTVLVHPPQFREPWDPVVDSGVEFIGRSAVLLGLLRLYGGGGLWIGARPNPSSEGDEVRLAGGGFFGLEAFASPQLSFTFEVGGQGAGHGLRSDAGARVMGGVLYYFGR